jgi:hypothetical protein
MVYFKETIVSGYFLAWSSPVWVFVCSTLSTQEGGGELVAMVGMTPYSLFLKVPWFNNRLASSDFSFSFRTRRPLV